MMSRSPRPLASRIFALLLLPLSACTAVSYPGRELATARQTLQQAETAEAHRYAPLEFAQARLTLNAAEELLNRHNYEQALPLLRQAASEGENALTVARTLASEPRQQDEPPAPVITLPPPTVPSPSPPRAKPTHYTVTGNETLRTIAMRPEIYDDPLLWPLIYQANRDQIKDPNRLHDGQVLSIPRNVSETARNEARIKGKKSETSPQQP